MPQTCRSSVGFSSLYIGILAATPNLSRKRLQWRGVSVPFTSGSSLQRSSRQYTVAPRSGFQFPLHRDPRCNQNRYSTIFMADAFQFPLHRDPRCNLVTGRNSRRLSSFSSLYIGILAATEGGTPGSNNCRVSVPFTSGSSLQQELKETIYEALNESFSSLYIGILAATLLALVPFCIPFGPCLSPPQLELE